MKHILRSPLLPVLLILVLIAGTCFMALFQKGMDDDRLHIEEIYNNTQIKINVLPDERDGSILRMNTHRGDQAITLPEVSSSYYLMRCDCTLVDAEFYFPYATAYGTNNPDALAVDQNCVITYGDGWDAQRVMTYSEDEIPGCIMSETLAKSLELSFNDTFVITGGTGDADAPNVTLTLAGMYSGNQTTLDLFGLVVSKAVFLTDPKLLHNSTMMYDCFYRAYQLEVDPAYNGDIDAVIERVEKALIDKYTIQTNARTMRQAVRPIERKLQVQAFLELPLALTFCAAAAVLAALLAMNCKREAFLRFLHGERRFPVFFKLFGSILLVLLLGALLATGVSLAITGIAYLSTALKQICGTIALSIPVAGFLLGIYCCRNLVKLYQGQEG